MKYNFQKTLMSKYLLRLSKDTAQETYKINLRIISVHFNTAEDLYGVYLKVKRGKNRMIGHNRYAIYSGTKNVEINEVFEQTSVFYRNINNYRYQPKMIVIKLKQENIQQKKDKVLARVVFDASLFVNKRNMISELNF